MKVCIKCKAEYPDDMAFCSYCGIPLQAKAQEHVCPTCGKVMRGENLYFCPYCGQRFNALKITKSEAYVDIKPVINAPLNTTNSDNNTCNSEKSSQGSFLKNALIVVGAFILISLARACGNVLSR